MHKSEFGEILRSFRMKTHYPKTRKPITQKELGQFLFEEIGIRYSGAAVSDWERDVTKIQADNLPLLITIIKILKKYDGIKKLAEANQLLEAGNFRNLSPTEQKEIFPDAIVEEEFQTKNENQKNNSVWLDFISRWFFDSPEEFEQVWKKVNEGPPPPWARLAVAIINKGTAKLFPIHFLNLMMWSWIFLGIYLSIIPSLRFPFATKQIALYNMVLYALGSLLLPLTIGLMFNIKDNPFWKAKNLEKTFMLRMYVVIGAYMGFHVTYFLLFLPIFILKYLHVQIGVRTEILVTLIMIIISYGSAQLIPHNFWLVYKNLNFKEGRILFSFVFIGIFWAWFFLEFYDTLVASIIGLPLVLGTITFIIINEIYKSRKKNKN